MELQSPTRGPMPGVGPQLWRDPQYEDSNIRLNDLWQIVRVEVSATALRAIWPHMSVLINISDALWRSPASEQNLRSFLRYINDLHTEVDAARRAREEAELRCTELERRLQAWSGKAIETHMQGEVRAGVHQYALDWEMSLRQQTDEDRRLLQMQLERSEAHNNAQRSELISAWRRIAHVEHQAEEGLRFALGTTERRLNEHRVQELSRQYQEFESLVTEARETRSVAEARLVDAEANTAASNEETRQARIALEEWSLLLPPCVSATVNFFRQQPRLPWPRVRGELPQIPVLALRWAPSICLDTAPTWANLCGGPLSLLDRLQAGEIHPKDLALDVCAVEGRHFVLGENNSPHNFGALLMFQALRGDSLVMAPCRVRHTRSFAELKGFSVGCGFSVGPPQDALRPLFPQQQGKAGAEAFLQFLLSDSPFEHHVLAALRFHKARGSHRPS